MRNKQRYQWPALSVGTCYYPEHWDESLWAEDLQRMQTYGIRCIRIAEFAWSIFEKTEGVFDFSLFDRFMALVAGTDIKVIFGTPTATPPAWLTNKYPEALNCRQDGVPYRHGMRRHYNYNSPVYREKTAIIVQKLAEHYGAHPSIVGWQIDNELNCETDNFYSEADSAAFRRFLQEKYGTLDALNAAWGTVVWSQTYTDWADIFVPRTTIHDSTNPHHVLDYIRFVSASTLGYAKLQADIIRIYAKEGDFITTNGMFGHMDNHTMTDTALDVYTYDSYPNFAYCLYSEPWMTHPLKDRVWSNSLAEVRSICPHFGIMEQQSGAMGWNTRMEAPAPKRGQMTLWAMQSIAHGADYISFFRYRTACFGTEIYWHGLLDYDNRDNHKTRELQALTARLEKLQALTGSDYRAAYGVLRDYDNRWDADVDRWHRRLIEKSEDALFTQGQVTHTPMDYVTLLDCTEVQELAKYPVLFAPHMLIVTPEKAALLEEYVRGGGTLVLGARCGQKDIHGHCVMMPMPGLLSSLTGTTVEEYTFVGPHDGSVKMAWQDKTLDTGIFNDVLAAADPQTQVLAVYTGGDYAGQPALTERKVGSGRVLHFGGTFTRETVQALLTYTGILSPMENTLSLPECCELSVREKDGARWAFVLNFAHEDTVITLNRPLVNEETGITENGAQTLKRFEVRVYRL